MAIPKQANDGQSCKPHLGTVRLLSCQPRPVRQSKTGVATVCALNVDAGPAGRGSATHSIGTIGVLHMSQEGFRTPCIGCIVEPGIESIGEKKTRSGRTD